MTTEGGMESGLGDDVPYDLLLEIGLMVVVWAQSELALDAIVGIIFHDCGGRRLEKNLPISLGNKLTFIKRAHARFSVLAPFRDRAKIIVDDANRLKERRHEVIHGTAMRRMGDGSFVFVRVHSAGQYHGTTIKNLTPAAINKATMEMAQHSARVADFARELAAAFSAPDSPTINSAISRHVRSKRPKSQR